MIRRTFLTTALAAVAGCSQRPPRAPKPVLQRPKVTDVLCAVYDKSGSYAQTFAEKAYPAAVSMFRQFKRDLAGEEGTQVILANISSATEGPFFRGTLGDFAKAVRGAGDFQQLLARFGGGSRVFDSITEACELMEAGVTDDSRACLCLFTDFEDNLSAPGGEDKMVAALTRLARKGASCGCYWVPSAFLERANGYMRRAGFKHSVVGWEKDASITLPTFEK